MNDSKLKNTHCNNVRSRLSDIPITTVCSSSAYRRLSCYEIYEKSTAVCPHVRQTGLPFGAFYHYPTLPKLRIPQYYFFTQSLAEMRQIC